MGWLFVVCRWDLASVSKARRVQLMHTKRLIVDYNLINRPRYWRSLGRRAWLEVSQRRPSHDTRLNTPILQMDILVPLHTLWRMLDTHLSVGDTSSSARSSAELDHVPQTDSSPKRSVALSETALNLHQTGGVAPLSPLSDHTVGEKRPQRQHWQRHRKQNHPSAQTRSSSSSNRTSCSCCSPPH